VADTCAIVECGQAREFAQWCEKHADRIVMDEMWVPCTIDGDHIVCGWCKTRVWVLENIEKPMRPRYVLEREPATDGKCLITGGGFRILRGIELTNYARSDHPLYRSHGPRCERRAAWASWLESRV
jgi:hypothetical protein